MSGLVLFVTDLLHPIDNFPVLLFLNCDVRHGRRGCCAVPVLLAGREPDHITGPDLLNWSAFALSPPTASRDDESLAERMRVPRGPRSGLESYAGALNKCRIGRLKKRIDPDCAGEPVLRPLAGRLRANSFDFHVISFF
jgi:hypothetical protein